jgi:preprotein translocase subunit SecF
MKTQRKTFTVSAVLLATLGFASFSTLAETAETSPTQVEGPTKPNAKGDNQLQSQEQIRNRVNEQQAIQVRSQAMQMRNNAMQVKDQAQQMRNVQAQQKAQGQFKGAH